MLFNWKLFPGTNLQDLNLDWIINFVKMIPSRLPKFSDHHTWLVYNYSTGEYYDSGEPTGGAGESGPPGKSPIIGANGNWYTWNTETETYTDTGTRAQGVQGVQGEPGAGVASGGVAGDVLVKASGVDYNTGWTATPPQMGSLAHINAGNTADQLYNPGDYLVWNGQLYKVGDTAISQGVTLNPGTGGNISAVSATGELPKQEVLTSFPSENANITNVERHYARRYGAVTVLDLAFTVGTTISDSTAVLFKDVPASFSFNQRFVLFTVDNSKEIVLAVTTDGTIINQYSQGGITPGAYQGQCVYISA